MCLKAHFLVAQKLYIKHVKCLHSGAACVLFLRAAGWPACLILGVQQQPFVAHAWVELDTAVVTGTQDRDMYVVMDSL